MSNKIIIIKRTMQKGYKFQERDDNMECLASWIKTWEILKDFFLENDIKSIESFDNTYELAQCLFNWVMDFHEVLQNFGDKTMHIDFCNWLIPLYNKDDENLCVIKMDLGDIYFLMGDTATGETHYQNLIAEFPKYGYVRINWSYNYWSDFAKEINFKKGEEILLEALTINEIEDKEMIYKTLSDLYNKSGQKEKYKKIRQKIKKTPSNTFILAPNTLSGERALKEGNIQENVPYGFGIFDNMNHTESGNVKIGRNAPCPCGSGKKYKKCCSP